MLDGQKTLVDWGVKSVQGDKNAQSLVKAGELMLHFQPQVLVLEDHSAEDSRRSHRIRALSQQILEAASNHRLHVALFPRAEVRKVFFADGKGTKHALAEILAKRFPEELGFRLPPKRRPWTSEYYQMNIFDAVALALVFGLKTKITHGP